MLSRRFEQTVVALHTDFAFDARIIVFLGSQRALLAMFQAFRAILIVRCVQKVHTASLALLSLRGAHLEP